MVSEAPASLLLELAAIGEADPVLDWEQVFGNGNPVELEIGVGKGRFLIDAAQRCPEVNYVGVEWAAKYLRLAHQRALKRSLHNLRLVRADGREFVEFFVPSGSLRALHIYFPDPWPKKRHHKRRLVNADFVSETERVLRDGGQLWLVTDYAEYFEAMLQVLGRSRMLWVVEPEWPGVPTNYEDKYRVAGRRIHRYVVEKRVGAG